MLNISIASDDWAILCLASKQLSLEVMLDETNKAATWGPIPQVDKSTYLVEKSLCSDNIWVCFRELISWGAALLCRSGEAIVLDKSIMDLLISALRIVLAALASAVELDLENNGEGAASLKKWNRYEDDYSYG